MKKYVKKYARKYLRKITAGFTAAIVMLGTIETYIPVFAENIEETDITTEVMENIENASEQVLTATSGNAQIISESVCEADNYEVAFNVDSEWETGYNATITITNTCTKPIDNWYLSFNLADEIQNLQSGKVMEHEGNIYLVKNAGWNQDIPVGGSVNFTFTALKSGDSIIFPTAYSMDTALTDIDSGRYTTEFIIQSDWGTGFTSVLNITNTSDETITDWKLMFRFNGNITNIGGGELVMSDNGLYQVDAFAYDYGIEPGETRSIQIIGSRESSDIVPTDISLMTVEYYVPAENPEVNPDTNPDTGTTPIIDDSRLNAEIAKMTEINGGTLPKMYLDEEDDIPCFIDGKYSSMKVVDVAAAIESLHDITYIMEIDWEVMSFEEVSTKTYKDSVHYRLQQMYDGLEVCGKQLIVTTDLEGNITTLSGDFDPIYVPDTPETSVSVDMATAAATASQELGADSGEGRLVWYSMEEGYDEPAWYFEGNDMCVYVSAVYGDSLMSYPTIASSQEQITINGAKKFNAEYDEENQVYLLVDKTRNIEVRGLGSVSLENNLNCVKDASRISNFPEDIRLMKGISTWGMDNDNTTYVYDVSYSRSRIWDEPDDAEFMVYATNLYDYYLETLGLVGYDNRGSLLRVAYDPSEENNSAADLFCSYFSIPYDSEEMMNNEIENLQEYAVNLGIIRVGPEYFNMDKIGVLGHEYGHLIEGSVVDEGVLLLENEAGTIKEAFADSMAELFDCSNGICDWDYVDRDIANHYSKNKNKTMPISVSEETIENKHETHFNSTIISHLVYRLYQQGFADAPTMTEWLYRSLYYLPSDARFIHLRGTLINIAEEMGLDAEMVAKEFDNANVILKEYSPTKNVVEYEMYVYDEKTNQPLKGAIITFKQENKNYVFYTDESGYVVLKLKDKNTTFFVQYTGFNLQEIRYEKGMFEKEKDVPLIKNTGYEMEQSTIKGYVSNSINNQKIPGVTIKFRKGVNMMNGRVYATVVTDAKGYYSVSDLPYGMYTMEISKDLYITKYETIIVGNPLYYNHEYPIIFTPKMNNGELRIVLIWGRNPSDLDSHVICYNEGRQRYHLDYVNKFYGTEARLDRDCRSGYGPETVTIKYNNKYDYRYYVDWFYGSGTWQSSNAIVEVYYNNKSIGIFKIDEDDSYGREWPVFTFRNGQIFSGDVE